MAVDSREGYIGDLEAASQLIPTDRPYVMMNMFNFRPVAQYASDFPGAPAPSTSISGPEAYTIYRDEFTKKALELGITAYEFVFQGQAHTNIIAGEHEGESWDMVLMVRFDSFASFRSVLEHPDYVAKILPHRLAAVREFKSFAVSEPAS